MNENFEQNIIPNENEGLELGPIELNLIERVEKGLHISFDIDSLSQSSKREDKFKGPKEIIFCSGWANINSLYKDYIKNFILKILISFAILISIHYLDCNFILVPLIFAIFNIVGFVKNLVLLMRYRSGEIKLRMIFFIEMNTSLGLSIYFIGFILGYLNLIRNSSLILFGLPYLLIAFLLFIFDENKYNYLYQKKFDIFLAVQLIIITIKFTNPQSILMNYTLFIFLVFSIYYFFLGFFLIIIFGCSFFKIYNREVENWKIKALFWMSFYYLSSGFVFIMFIKSINFYCNEKNFLETEIESYFEYNSTNTIFLDKSAIALLFFSSINLIMHLKWKKHIKRYLAKIVYKKEIQKEVTLRFLTENFTFNLIQISSTYFTKDLTSKNKEEDKNISPKFDNQEKCILCYDKFPDILIDPCCHGGVCKSCMVAYLKSDGKNCPLCKSKIEKLYLLEIEKENNKIFAKGEIKL